MPSVFTKIITGEVPSFKVYEDDLVISFLALDQINMGHCLVVPKNEVDHFFDADDESYNRMFSVSQKISKVIKKVTGCVRVGLAAQGFEVSHAHIHLIPLWSPKEFSFALGKKRENSEMEKMKQQLIQELNNV